MLERLLLLVYLTSLHRLVNACSHITGTQIFPSSITLSSSYAEVRCNHDTTLEFVSFYLPSGTTLTTSSLPKHELVNRQSHSTLIVNNIDPIDIGQYQCNFHNEHGDDCFEQINLQLDIDFCTPDSVTYHQYIGGSVTLDCCVNNHDNQYWKRDDSEDPITENEHVQLMGTSLRLSSLSLEDEGRYICVAIDGVGEETTLTADLKVYERLSISVEPQQKVVNVSERAELTCTASSYPLPTIVWTREVFTELQLQPGVIQKTEMQMNATTIQSVLTFFSVNDAVTGTYHCTGAYSNGTLSVVASLQLFGTPSAPLDVTLSIANQTSINVTWKPPLDDGHLQLLSYSIMWFRMEANGSTLGGSSQVDGAITNYIITGLLPVTNYSVTIYAINGRGKGVGSKEQTTLTLPSVPGALTQLDSSQLTPTSVHIEFTIPTDTGGSPITHLRVSYEPGREEEYPSVEIFTLPGAVPLQKRSQKLENLKGDTSYTVKVSVGNAIGFGEERVALFRTLRPGYPATPTSLRALPGEIGATRLRLAWEVLDVGELSVGYLIRAVEEGKEEDEGKLFTVDPDDVHVDGTTESAEISPLAPATCYTFTVAMKSQGAMGFTSQPSNTTCTLPCSQQTSCDNNVAGIRDEKDANRQLIPILVVTVIVAVVVVLAVVLVAILSRRYSKRRSKSSISLFPHNQSFANSTSSSQFGVDRSASSLSSSLNYNRQISQNSSSLADVDEPPTTSSSTVSDNPFYFGTMPHSQNGTPHYQNRPHHYENGTELVSNLSECPQQVAVIGAKTMGSFPLFPIPEHTVAMGGHFENSAPAIPIRAHQQLPERNHQPVMTDNPAFQKPHNLPVASHHGVPHTPEDSTPPPPPIPPPTYRRGSQPEVEPTTHHLPPPPPPPPHIHVHTAHHQGSLSASYYNSSHSLTLGESFSQASRSPAMPRTAEFFLPPDGEEDEVEFTDNDAYESASPQPPRHDNPPPLNPSTSSSSVTLPQSSTNLSVASTFLRGQSSSPVLSQRRGSAQSTGSGVSEGPPPRFEISRQQDSRERGRAAVFETVTIRSHV